MYVYTYIHKYITHIFTFVYIYVHPRKPECDMTDLYMHHQFKGLGHIRREGLWIDKQGNIKTEHMQQLSIGINVEVHVPICIYKNLHIHVSICTRRVTSKPSTCIENQTVSTLRYIYSYVCVYIYTYMHIFI